MSAPDGRGEAIVSVAGLHAGYGENFSVAVPHLDLNRGETVALIGPSGCGKTTLLNVIAGIHVPDAGTVRVAGVELHGSGVSATDAERRKFRITDIGLVFQAFELLEHLSVRENILLPYFVNAALKRGDAVEERVDAIARDMGLGELLRRHPSALSQGERQRVAIARALVTEPLLLLADEPTGNLDPDTSTRILDLLFGAVRERNATLLMVTHDHALLERFDRVVDLMSLGAEAA